MKKTQYKEIILPALGKEQFRGDYGAKGFAVTFVYSNRGNFLVRGYWGETRLFLAELVKTGYRFYYQYSFYANGKPRFTHTEFYKDNVYVLAPEKRTSEYGKNRNKFEFRRNSKTIVCFKRLPKRWVPELETL